MVILADLGAVLGPLGSLLGRLGAVLGRLGQSKTLIFLAFVNTFCNINIFSKHGHLGRSWGSLEPAWASLGVSWGDLERS